MLTARPHERSSIRPPAPSVVYPAGSIAAPAATREERDARRAAVFDAVPRILRFVGKFGAIAVPAGMDTAANMADANLPAVYLIRRIEVPQETGDLEVAYVGSSWFLSPPDVTAATSGTIHGIAQHVAAGADTGLPWGDTAKQHEALIGVGVNIPLERGAWGQVGVPFPGLMDTPQCYAPSEDDSPWLELIPFPKGRYIDGSESPPNVGDSNERIGHVPLPAQCTLDICLIVRRSYIVATPAVQHYLRGAARVTVRLDATVKVPNQWR